MLHFGFMWVLQIYVYISYPIRKYGDILVQPCLGGIHIEMKAGDSGKGIVGVNGHFLFVRNSFIHCV